MLIAPCVVAKAIVARVRSKLVFWFYFETGNGVAAKKRSVKLLDTEYYAREETRACLEELSLLLGNFNTDRPASRPAVTRSAENEGNNS